MLLLLSHWVAMNKRYNSSTAKSYIKRQACSSQDYVVKETFSALFPSKPHMREVFVLAG